MKKVTSYLILIGFVICFLDSSAFAMKQSKYNNENEVENVLQKYFDGYFQTFVDLKFINLDDILIKNDNTLLYEKIRENEMNSYIDYNYAFNDYTTHLTYNTLQVNDTEAQISLILDVDYHYTTSKDIDSGLYDIDYKFKLKKQNGKWRIFDINTNFDEFKNFKDKVNENFKKGLSIRQATSEVSNQRKKDRQITKKIFEKNNKNTVTKMNLLTNSTDVTVLEGPIVEDPTIEPEATFSYYSSNGKSYAERFAEASTSSRFFYTASGTDCTNFVSQCVWAAYGGYVSNDDAKTKSNINNKVRMVTNIWHGGTGGGMPNWENVEKFYAYVKDTAKTSGPKASVYGNTKAYSITPASMSVGNVLQVRNGSSGVYGHSVYVTSNAYNGSYSGVLVCQHSNEKKNRSVQNLIDSWGGSNCYMRGLSFKSAVFSK